MKKLINFDLSSDHAGIRIMKPQLWFFLQTYSPIRKERGKTKFLWGRTFDITLEAGLSQTTELRWWDNAEWNEIDRAGAYFDVSFGLLRLALYVRPIVTRKIKYNDTNFKS